MSWRHGAQAAIKTREKRRTPRVHANAPLKILTMRGPMDATLIDISLTGCRIHSQYSAMLLQRSRIQFVTSHFDVGAEMVWRRGQTSGWRFIYSPSQAIQIQVEIATLNRRSGHRPD